MHPKLLGIVSFCVFVVACAPAPGVTPTAAPSAAPTRAPSSATPVGPHPLVFPSADGVSLGGTLYGGGTHTVILSNIGSGVQADWQELPQVLAQHGYAVLTYDWRGLGESKGTREWTLADKDLAGAIGFMRGQGAKQIVLVGGSLGGMASLKNAGIAELAGIVVISSPRTAQSGGQTFVVSESEITAIRAPKLFIGSKEDKIVAYAETVNLFNLAGEPKQMQGYEGSAHGSDILKTANRESLVTLLLEFIGTVMPSR